MMASHADRDRDEAKQPKDELDLYRMAQWCKKVSCSKTYATMDFSFKQGLANTKFITKLTDPSGAQVLLIRGHEEEASLRTMAWYSTIEIDMTFPAISHAAIHGSQYYWLSVRRVMIVPGSSLNIITLSILGGWSTSGKYYRATHWGVRFGGKVTYTIGFINLDLRQQPDLTSLMPVIHTTCCCGDLRSICWHK